MLKNFFTGRLVHKRKPMNSDSLNKPYASLMKVNIVEIIIVVPILRRMTITIRRTITATNSFYLDKT